MHTHPVCAYIPTYTHTHIRQVYDVVDTEESLSIVMELVHGGDLLDRLLKMGKPFTPPSARNIFAQVRTRCSTV